jgi:hypothetical protein
MKQNTLLERIYFELFVEKKKKKIFYLIAGLSIGLARF